ncbi:MAG: hypothetical protein ACLPVY_10790 [Acidimicrobiia bacterium]
MPTSAWLLSGGTALGLAVATGALLARRGTNSFYAEGDAATYRLIAADLFGRANGFTNHADAAYRYGRVGLPFLGWLFAFGRPGAVGSTLIWVNVAAIAAIPGLAATLLEGYDSPGVAGAIVVLAAGLFALSRDPVAEPLMIALIVLAYVLDAHGGRRSALVVLAYAVLVKEVAALALVPWLWRAVRTRNWRDVGGVGAALVPYASWCAWVRWRIGAFPFLAHTVQRTGAIGLPFAGMWTTWNDMPHHSTTILTLTSVTIALAAAAAWAARRSPIGGLAAAFGCLTLCLGPNALRFSFEIGRLLAPAQVFALVALAIAGSTRRTRRPALVTLQRDPMAARR